MALETLYNISKYVSFKAFPIYNLLVRKHCGTFESQAIALFFLFLSLSLSASSLDKVCKDFRLNIKLNLKY